MRRRYLSQLGTGQHCPGSLRRVFLAHDVHSFAYVADFGTRAVAVVLEEVFRYLAFGEVTVREAVDGVE